VSARTPKSSFNIKLTTLIFQQLSDTIVRLRVHLSSLRLREALHAELCSAAVQTPVILIRAQRVAAPAGIVIFEVFFLVVRLPIEAPTGDIQVKLHFLHQLRPPSEIVITV
jgi:hypothetical protein